LGEKFLSMPSFGREVKPFVPCRRFAACQRTLKLTVEVANCWLNYRIFLARFRSSLTEDSNVARHRAPLEMTDGTKWRCTKGLLA
jgi:hypothetical protein